MALTDVTARPITTPLDWADLVLADHTRKEVDALRAQLEQPPQLLADKGLRQPPKPGYRALFYGPPGTGKTLTASLLGKAAGQPVYRVDLSTVVSEYVNETEKNLAQLFDTAERENWMLFFDEADALFGKRTAVGDAHDHYANLETAYLFQRLESFPGVVVVAASAKSNLDPAFTRRFQSIIHFPLPAPAERRQLWQQAFAAAAVLPEDAPLDDIAEKHALAGGAIANVLRYCVLAARRQGRPVSLADVENGIRRELVNEPRAQ